MDKYKSVRLIFPQNTNLRLATLLRRRALSRHLLDTRVIKYKIKVILAIQALSDSISANGFFKKKTNSKCYWSYVLVHFPIKVLCAVFCPKTIGWLKRRELQYLLGLGQWTSKFYFKHLDLDVAIQESAFPSLLLLVDLGRQR